MAGVLYDGASRTSDMDNDTKDNGTGNDTGPGHRNDHTEDTGDWSSDDHSANSAGPRGGGTAILDDHVQETKRDPGVSGSGTLNSLNSVHHDGVCVSSDDSSEAGDAGDAGDAGGVGGAGGAGDAGGAGGFLNVARQQMGWADGESASIDGDSVSPAGRHNTTKQESDQVPEVDESDAASKDDRCVFSLYLEWPLVPGCRL